MIENTWTVYFLTVFQTFYCHCLLLASRWRGPLSSIIHYKTKFIKIHFCPSCFVHKRKCRVCVCVCEFLTLLYYYISVSMAQYKSYWTLLNQNYRCPNFIYVDDVPSSQFWLAATHFKSVLPLPAFGVVLVLCSFPKAAQTGLYSQEAQ